MVKAEVQIDLWVYLDNSPTRTIPHHTGIGPDLLVCSGPGGELS